jgi:inorganic triphosphatase YgiF
MENCSPLRPSEFACLEHRDTLLYTEIIQVVEKRHRYWARPVLLCERSTQEDNLTESRPTVYDVRSCSDLLWPRSLFRSVLDTELIPLLACLDAELEAPFISTKILSSRLAEARQKLQQFTQRLWRIHPEAFQDSETLEKQV